jgi:hypothetical protein
MRSLSSHSFGAASIVATVFLWAAAPTLAQSTPRTIETTAGQDWKHVQTGVIIPAKLSGFDREYVRDLTDKELDVIAQYYSDESRTRLTLFLYRAALDSVPLWFDTADISLRKNTSFVPGTTEFVSSTFTPPGQSRASGMMTVYASSGGDFKATGIAMMPLNGWLAKVRFTSAELTALEMAAALQPILAAVTWPENILSGPVAVPVQPCKNKLKLTEKVKRIKPTMADALIGGLLGVAAETDGTIVEKEAIVYCRDPQDFGQFSAYRANGSKNGYILPLGDAGRALSISQNEAGGLIGGSKGKRYTPMNMQLDQTIIYPDLNKLPTPRLLLAATGDDAAISSTTTWPEGDTTINIGISEENEDR